MYDQKLTIVSLVLHTRKQKEIMEKLKQKKPLSSRECMKEVRSMSDAQITPQSWNVLSLHSSSLSPSSLLSEKDMMGWC